MSLTIDTFITGPLEVNSYLLRSGQEACLVDPGSMMPDKLTAYLDDNDVQITQIWLTHGHGDHISGVSLIKARYPDAKLICPANDAEMLTDATANLSSWYMVEITSPPADELIEAGASLTLGETEWQVLDTSGHTPGGVSFYCAEESVVITGDALFAGSIGKTEIPNGDLPRLLGNIHEHLLSLPDETRVLPGHMDESTIGRERKGNFFLRKAPP
jgi:hydroxyacylglutathione hydrolase